jgi:hypothetical protein
MPTAAEGPRVRSPREQTGLPSVASRGVIPVPVRDGGPARVPLITRAPVIAGRRGRRRSAQGSGPSASPKTDNANPTLTSAVVVRRADGLACLIVAISHEFPLAGIQASSGSARTPKPPVAQEAAPKLATLCDQSTGSRG